LGNGEPLFPDTTSKQIEERLVELVHAEYKNPLLPINITHGDYGPWNLLYGPLAVLKAVIDFDDVMLEERIEEVAASLISFSGKSNISINLDDGREFLKSYHNEFPITVEEIRILPWALERYLLKMVMKIARRYKISASTVDHNKLVMMVAWLEWLEEQGHTILNNLTKSISRMSS
jgi:Ser/Thr protein kinase RdoA (MazF antagonist)